MRRIKSFSYAGRIIFACIFIFLWLQISYANEELTGSNNTNLTFDKFSDAHVHIIDFLQNGAFDNSDGRFQGIDPRGRIQNSTSIRYLSLPYGEQWRRLTLLLRDMQEGNIEYVMICGLPFLKKWSENEPFTRPGYYLDSSSRMVLARDTDFAIGTAVLDYMTKFANDEQALKKLQKIYPFVCGFDSTDLGAVDLVIKRIKEFPGVWQGIGEVMSRHDDLTNLTTGERPRGNHPALKRLCCFAGDWFLPVSMHHNIAPISRSPTEVKECLYLDELVELIEYCQPPNTKHETKFIWAHAGISRRIVIENLPQWIDLLLSRFERQLYIDLSWVVYEDYILKDIESWVALIKKYPNSFMLGSDVVGGSEKMGTELHRYSSLLDRISDDFSDEIRQNLTKRNFARLMTNLGELRIAKMIEENVISADELQTKGLILRSDYEYEEKAHTGARIESFLKDNKSELR